MTKINIRLFHIWSSKQVSGFNRNGKTTAIYAFYLRIVLLMWHTLIEKITKPNHLLWHHHSKKYLDNIPDKSNRVKTDIRRPRHG